MKIEILKHDMNPYWDVYIGDFKAFMCETQIQAEFWAEVYRDNWLAAHTTPTGKPLLVELDLFEMRCISNALTATRGNKSRAAKLLQIKRTTLIDKCHKYGLDDLRREGCDELICEG